MKPVFVDVDGVVRDLETAVLGKDHDGGWAKEVDGMPFLDYVTLHRDTLLVDTPETEYCKALQEWSNLAGPRSFKFLTSQPDEWRPYTEKWLADRFPGTPVIYVYKPKDKIEIIKKFDGILIEDYPFFESYDNIVLVDRPYNHKVKSDRVSTPMEFLELMLGARFDGAFNEK